MCGQTDGTTGPDRYAALAWRAHALLLSRGGLAAAGELIAELFGPQARGPLFTMLLEQVLLGDARFERAGDGLWALAGRTAGARAIADCEFVILDLETTGLRPARSGVHELAALRWRNGLVVGSFAAVLNPGRRLPTYLASLTGLTQADVAGAPDLATVADDLVAFLGADVLVGHGLAADLAHLNHALETRGRSPLANPVLDTLTLAERFWPAHGKPTLDRLARALGLPVGRRHRALPDAHLVAGVFGHLLNLAAAAGARTLADLGVALPDENSYTLLDSSALDLVSEGPGVYLLLDSAAQVIYVGKAAKLRQRLGAYFSRPPAYVRRMEGLLESVADFQTVELGSELAALLEEARLIALHRPRFNVQLATHERPSYLRFDADSPCPRLQPVALPAADGARYFGPFRSEAEMRLRQRYLEGFFPFATCRRELLRPPKGRRAKPCARLAKGYCLGPCVDAGQSSAYASLAREFLSYLAGATGPTAARLHNCAAAAAASGDQPAARHWARRAREARLGFELPEAGGPAQSGDDFAAAVSGLEENRAEVFLLCAGAYAGSLLVAPDEEAESLAERLRAATKLAAAEGAGRGEVLRRWARARPDYTVSLPAAASDPEPWLAAAAAVLEQVDRVVNGAFLPDAGATDEEEDEDE